MSKTDLSNWQAVQAEVLRRIHTRIWVPGELIPTEQALAQEFGCARATVNRALQAVSEAGLLERRRKAGTRVALHPVRKAKLDIPILRQEIEGLGHRYGYHALISQIQTPPQAVQTQMQADVGDTFLRVKSVQSADGAPFVVEDRWINLTTVPTAAQADFSQISANEWLVINAPFSHGEIAFSALNADAEVAGQLAVTQGAAIFVIDRITWDENRAVTSVRQFFQAGYQMQTRL